MAGLNSSLFSNMPKRDRGQMEQFFHHWPYPLVCGGLKLFQDKFHPDRFLELLGLNLFYILLSFFSFHLLSNPHLSRGNWTGCLDRLYPPVIKIFFYKNHIGILSHEFLSIRITSSLYHCFLRSHIQHPSSLVCIANGSQSSSISGGNLQFGANTRVRYHFIFFILSSLCLLNPNRYRQGYGYPLQSISQ